jgi:hypothetical protein
MPPQPPPPPPPKPPVLVTKDKNEKDLQDYFKKYFTSFNSVKIALSADEKRRQNDEYKTHVENYFKLYGKDFFDFIINTRVEYKNNPQAIGDPVVGLSPIGKEYYTNNLLRVRAASLRMQSNKALISVPKELTDKGKNILDSGTSYRDQTIVPYQDLPSYYEPRLSQT